MVLTCTKTSLQNEPPLQRDYDGFRNLSCNSIHMRRGSNVELTCTEPSVAFNRRLNQYYQHICIWINLSVLFDCGSRMKRQKFDFDSDLVDHTKLMVCNGSANQI